MKIDTEPRMRALFVGGLHSAPDEYPELAAMLDKENFTFEPVEHDLINPDNEEISETLREMVSDNERYLLIGHSLGAIAVVLAASQLYKSHRIMKKYGDNDTDLELPPMPQGIVLLSPAPLIGSQVRHTFNNLHTWKHTMAAEEFMSLPKETLTRLEEEHFPRTFGGVITQIYFGLDHETPFNALVAGALSTIEEAELYPIPMAAHKPNILEYLRPVARHIGHLRVPEHSPNYRWSPSDTRGYSLGKLHAPIGYEDQRTITGNGHQQLGEPEYPVI